MRKRFYITILCVGLLLMIVSCILYTHNYKLPKQPTMTQSLAFEPHILDFGKVLATKVITSKVSVRNNSNQPIKIKSVRACCGCTTDGIEPCTLKPKEEKIFHVSIDARTSMGPFTRMVAVTFGADEVSNLLVKGNVLPVAKITPEKIKIDISGTVKSYIRTVDIISESIDKPIQSVTTSHKGIQAHLIPSKTSEKQRIEIKVNAKDFKDIDNSEEYVFANLSLQECLPLKIPISIHNSREFSIQPRALYFQPDKGKKTVAHKLSIFAQNSPILVPSIKVVGPLSECIEIQAIPDNTQNSAYFNIILLDNSLAQDTFSEIAAVVEIGRRVSEIVVPIYYSP